MCPHKHAHTHTHTHTHTHIDRQTLTQAHTYTSTNSNTHTHTHTHTLSLSHSILHTHTHSLSFTHTCCFLWFKGTLHRHNGFYTVQTVCAIALHLNLALTGDCISTYPTKKSLCMIYKCFESWGHWKCRHKITFSLYYLSYPCHYTYLCPHKPHNMRAVDKQTHTGSYQKDIKTNTLIKHFLKVKVASKKYAPSKNIPFASMDET